MCSDLQRHSLTMHKQCGMRLVWMWEIPGFTMFRYHMFAICPYIVNVLTLKLKLTQKNPNNFCSIESFIISFWELIPLFKW